MLLDIYTHVFPGKYFEQVDPELQDLSRRMRNMTQLHDLDARFRNMDAFAELRGSDYRQVIALPCPPLEDVSDPKSGARLARVANDAMADLVRRHPSRFAAFVAGLPLHNLDAAMTELHRATHELGAKGVQIWTHASGHPLDGPEFRPIFAAMAELDLPIWLHPWRTAAMRDYAAESRSRYEMWWCFGWPYETSVAMARLVFSGVFDRHPNLKIITHHLGGMIPYFSGRIEHGLKVLGARTDDEDYSEVLSSLKRPHIDYFHMFYADTAMFGGHDGYKTGLEFFGPDHVLFATDWPFLPIKEFSAALDHLEVDRDERARIDSGNAARLLNLNLT
jgi:aminocarboxymuconate-semialdehyde decarboxylase